MDGSGAKDLSGDEENAKGGRAGRELGIGESLRDEKPDASLLGLLEARGGVCGHCGVVWAKWRVRERDPSRGACRVRQ